MQPDDRSFNPESPTEVDASHQQATLTLAMNWLSTDGMMQVMSLIWFKMSSNVHNLFFGRVA